MTHDLFPLRCRRCSAGIDFADLADEYCSTCRHARHSTILAVLRRWLTGWLPRPGPPPVLYRHPSAADAGVRIFTADPVAWTLHLRDVLPHDRPLMRDWLRLHGITGDPDVLEVHVTRRRGGAYLAVHGHIGLRRVPLIMAPPNLAAATGHRRIRAHDITERTPVR